MSIILNIDTAQENASVSLSENGRLLGVLQNAIQKDHAVFLHPAIKQLLNEHRLDMKSIQAVSVTSGPGSYTGLRVGMAAAKGICHALQIPLISLCTLKTMANAVKSIAIEKDALICPMIDARRMEVFTALFNVSMETIISPIPMILNEHSFSAELQQQKIIFFGSGSAKFNSIINSEEAVFLSSVDWMESMCELAEESFSKAEFSDLATLTPNYLKEYQA